MLCSIFFYFSLAISLVHGIVITKTNTAIVCLTEKWHKTTATCTTHFGLNAPRSVPTAIVTSTRELPPIVIFSTSVTTITRTLNASTHVETSTVTIGTVTTLVAPTNTVVSTSSLFVTLTAHETLSLTSTIVAAATISTTVTSTIAAPSGFLPIDDTTSSIYPAPILTLLKRDVIFPRNSGKHLEDAHQGKYHGNGEDAHNGKHHGIIGGVHAINVRCVTTINVRRTKTVIIPGSTSISTITPAIISTTVLTTTTSTSTFVPPDISTTIDVTTTISATTTLTLTTSTSVTSTSTFYAVETATTYAACGASNLLGPQTPDGKYINNLFNQGADGSSLFTQEQANSAYDCCVSCINSPSCSGSGYTSGDCYMLHNLQNACALQGAYPAFYTTQSSGPGFTLSNGRCGFIYRGD